MFRCAAACRESLPPEVPDRRFHSVELPINPLKTHYHCRLRENGVASMFVLIKEGSDILGCLRVGDILDVRYYCTDEGSEPENLDTEITYIMKTDSGKFKGHYLVGLDIVQYEHRKSMSG